MKSDKEIVISPFSSELNNDLSKNGIKEEE